MSDYFELIERRESCRSFSDRPVEREKLERCISAARIAPSACNSQPWRYLVVTNPELCEKLRPCVQGLGMNRFADQCRAFVVVVEEPANLSERVAKVIKQQHFAPVDIGLSVSQLCYAATEQGLSTCILGWLNEGQIKKLFSLGAEEHVQLVICVGYAAPGELRKKVRKPEEKTVSYYE